MPLFDCPFCRTSSIRCIARGGLFVHYRCEKCAEVWTAVDFDAQAARLLQRRPPLPIVRRN